MGERDMKDRGMKDKDEAKSRNSRAWKAVCAALLVAALICVAVACAGKANEDAALDTYEQLAEQTSKVPVDTEEPEESGESTEEEPEESEEPADILEELGVPIPEKEIDFEELRESTNGDIYAWIYIPDTKIDYPVLQHPTDNLYYLNHNLDGSSGYPGCIYTEDYNSKDFSDPVTVLYGHNMKNGSMFAGLHRYSDSEYLAEHPYVYVYTEEGMKVYRIFAVHEYSNEHLLYGRNYNETDEMQAYLDGIQGSRSMVSVEDIGVSVDASSYILTLSTCISNKPNNRFLVQGVLLNGE